MCLGGKRTRRYSSPRLSNHRQEIFFSKTIITVSRTDVPVVKERWVFKGVTGVKGGSFKKSQRLSVMSGLASNPANSEIASSSGASEHQDIFSPVFFSIFFELHFLKKLEKI
jgi:hypothetical protein